MVKTKEGQKGKARLSLRVENSISAPTQEIDLADPVTYMRLHNEAYLTRNPLAPLMYSEEKIDNTVPGSGSVIYPATDWRKELLKDFTMNQRVNLNITGGGMWHVIMWQLPIVRIMVFWRLIRIAILIITLNREFILFALM